MASLCVLLVVCGAADGGRYGDFGPVRVRVACAEVTNVYLESDFPGLFREPQMTLVLENTGAERAAIEGDAEAEQVHLAAAEGHVELDPDAQAQPEPPGRVEHGALLPPVGGERVVVGDRQHVHAHGRRAGDELRRRQHAVGKEGMTVQVEDHLRQDNPAGFRRQAR